MTETAIFLISIVGTIVSSMSGGGASVITIPVFIALGMSFPMALALHLLSCVFWVLPSSRNYLRGREINWKFLLLYSALGLIGVYFGIHFISTTDERFLKIGAGAIILFVVAFTYFKKKLGLREQSSKSSLKEKIMYVFSVPMGFYESVFGSGNGAIFSFLSFQFRGFDFIDALGYYYAISFPWTIYAAYRLISRGHFNWAYAIPAIAGSLIGGYIGSKYGRHKGNAFIKIVFIVVGGALGLKLVLGF